MGTRPSLSGVYETLEDIMKAPALEHFCDLTVELSDIIELGEGMSGRRRIIPIIGGEVRGERINGTILNVGYRHGPPDVIAAIARGEDTSPDEYYMRTHARLETGDARYSLSKQDAFHRHRRTQEIKVRTVVIRRDLR